MKSKVNSVYDVLKIVLSIMIDNKIFILLIVIITGILLTIIIDYLSKKWLKFLKYAY